jgi:hypothetical protein
MQMPTALGVLRSVHLPCRLCDLKSKKKRAAKDGMIEYMLTSH